MSEPAPKPDTPMLGSLDLTDERDRGLLRRKFGDHLGSTRRRWGVDDDFKDQAIKALRVALRMALEKNDHRGVNGCIKTLALIEGQNQSDEHLLEKYSRIDAGLATDSHDLKLYGKDAPTEAV